MITRSMKSYYSLNLKTTNHRHVCQCCLNVINLPWTVVHICSEDTMVGLLIVSLPWALENSYIVLTLEYLTNLENNMKKKSKIRH